MTSQETRGRLSKEAIYEDATRKELGSNPNGTRMDVVSRAMDMYAQQEAISFCDWRVRNIVNLLKERDVNFYPDPIEEQYQLFLKSQTT